MKQGRNRGVLLDQLRCGARTHDVQPRCGSFRPYGFTRGVAKPRRTAAQRIVRAFLFCKGDIQPEPIGQCPARGRNQQREKTLPGRRRGYSPRSRTPGSTKRVKLMLFRSGFDIAELRIGESHEKDRDNMGADVKVVAARREGQNQDEGTQGQVHPGALDPQGQIRSIAGRSGTPSRQGGRPAHHPLSDGHNALTQPLLGNPWRPETGEAEAVLIEEMTAVEDASRRRPYERNVPGSRNSLLWPAMNSRSQTDANVTASKPMMSFELHLNQTWQSRIWMSEIIYLPFFHAAC